MKKLHFKRIKLEFGSTDSCLIDIDKLIETEKSLLKDQNPKNEVTVIDKLTTITDNYYIIAFSIKDPFTPFYADKH